MMLPCGQVTDGIWAHRPRDCPRTSPTVPKVEIALTPDAGSLADLASGLLFDEVDDRERQLAARALSLIVSTSWAARRSLGVLAEIMTVLTHMSTYGVVGSRGLRGESNDMGGGRSAAMVESCWRNHGHLVSHRGSVRGDPVVYFWATCAQTPA